MIQAGLTNNEKEFCKFFKENLLNKNKANFDIIKTAATILGKKVDVSCPSCATSAWLELLNTYGQLEVSFNKENETQPIYTKFEESVLEEPKFKPLEEKPKTFSKKKNTTT